MALSLHIHRAQAQHRRLIGVGFSILLGIAWFVAAPVQCAAQQPDMESIGRRLIDSDSAEERIEILLMLRKAAKLPGMTRLIDPVVHCANDDRPEVRRAAVETMAHIAYHHQAPCPKKLIAALIDEDKSVRQTASANIVDEGYASFPANLTDVIEVALTHEDFRDVRAKAAILARNGEVDARRIDLLRQALYDRDRLVRNNAASTLQQLGLAQDEVLEYLAGAALGMQGQEQFSPALGRWDELAAPTETLLRKLAQKGIYQIAVEEPAAVARLVARQLSSSDPRCITRTLAHLSSCAKIDPPLGREISTASGDCIDLLVEHNDPQISELAAMAKHRLLDLDASHSHGR